MSLTDEELDAYLAETPSYEEDDLYSAFGGGDRDDPNDFSTGLSHGLKSLKATGLGLVGLVGDAVGSDSIRDWGFEGYQGTMAEMQAEGRAEHTYEGIDDFADAVDFAQYWLGYGASNLLAGLGAGAIGSAAAKKVAQKGVEKGVQAYIAKKTAEGTIKEGAESAIRSAFSNRLRGEIAKAQGKGFIAGSTAHGVGTELGATYGQAGTDMLAKGKGLDDVDRTKVVTYGTAAGLLESVADVATLGLAKIGPGKAMFDMLQGASRPVRATTKGLVAAGVEAGTEGLQTGLEEMGAGKSFEEADFTDPTSMLAGAIGGGPIGVVGGIMGGGGPKNSEPDPDVVTSDDLEQQMIAERQATQNAKAQEAQEAQEAVKQQKAQEAVVSELRRKHGPTFTPKDEFAKTLDSSLLVEADTPGSEVHEAYSQWQEENSDWSNTDKARKTFLKQFKQNAGVDLDAEYRAALDNYAAAQEQEVVDAETEVQAQADIEQELREYAANSLGVTWEEDNPDLSQLIGERRFKDFKVAVDKAVPESDTGIPARVVEGFSPHQRRVYDVLVAEMHDKGTLDDLLKKGRGTKQTKLTASSSIFSPTKVAKAAGLADAAAARDAIGGMQRKIAKHLGVEPSQVANMLSSKNKEVRTVESSEPMGGVAPEQQPKVLDKKALSEGGTQTVGTISSAGGSQSDVGVVDSADTEHAMSTPNTVLDQRQQEAMDRYEKERGARYDAVLQLPIAPEAARMWDQWRSEGAVKFEELNKQDAAEWVMDYEEYAALTDGVDDDYMDATQRDVERRYDGTDPNEESTPDENSTEQEQPSENSTEQEQPSESPTVDQSDSGLIGAGGPSEPDGEGETVSEAPRDKADERVVGDEPSPGTERVEAYAEHIGGKHGKQFVVDFGQVVKSGIAGTKFLHQIIRETKDKIPSATKWYEHMLAADMRRNELRGSVEDIAVAARKLTEKDRAATNDLIGKATFYQQWPYDTEVAGETVKAHDTLGSVFDSMTEAQQDIVQRVFAHGEEMKQLKQSLAKELGVSTSFFGYGDLKGPYAPLKRFGKWVTVLKSQKVRDAEATYNQLKALDERQGDKESTQTQNAFKVLEELRQNPNEYVVSHFDTKGRAAVFAKENKDKFAFADTFHKDVNPNEGKQPDYKTLEKVLGALKADNSELPSGAKLAFSNMVKDMYYQALDESNARLSGIRRLNRAGYDKDMIRSFLEHSKAESSLIANMEYGADINAAYVAAAHETKNDQGVQEYKDLFDQISYHYEDVMNGKDTPIQDRLTAVTTVWLLTSSVGYHVTNATQPIMATIPKIAGDFGSYASAWGRLMNGYKLAKKVVDVISDGALKPQTGIDLNKAPEKYRPLLERLQLMKLLDVGVEEDLSGFSRFHTGYGVVDQASEVMSAITHRLYQVARAVEAYNRVSSAVAAYDMAQAKPGVVRQMGLTPEEYAINIVQDTQGNFSRLDAPLLLKKLPKVTGQYRKYQFMMAWLYAGAFKQAFRGGSPELKAAGRRVLGYKLAHAAFMGGMMGVPLMNIASVLYAMTGGDDEEPKDLERSMRLWLKDNPLADAIMSGVPSYLGLDTNAKLGEQNVFSIAPYTDFDMSSRDGLAKAAWGLAGGATASVAGNMADAYGLMKDGAPYKAAEKFLPKGLRDIMEAYRLSEEGYSLRNGDVIVDPGEFSAWLLSSSLGLPVTEVRKIKWTRHQQWEIEEYYKERSADLRRQYIQAKKDNDRTALRELRKSWTKLQNSKDKVRHFFSDSKKALRKQPMSALIRSSERQRKREQKYRSYMEE